MTTSMQRWQARRTDKRNLRVSALLADQANRSDRREALSAAYRANAYVSY